jgi:hypothetical protein
MFNALFHDMWSASLTGFGPTNFTNQRRSSAISTWAIIIFKEKSYTNCTVFTPFAMSKMLISPVLLPAATVEPSSGLIATE